MRKNRKSFLYDYQMDAVDRMFNGCILCGGVGSGKSRTALYYYFKEQGGSIEPNYIPMKEKPLDLYIITTARKRDTLEWEGELTPFLMTSSENATRFYNHKVIVDSWNNIKKYTDVENAFFIFDEQRVVGYGAWTNAFLKITKVNKWILLSATPGDTWSDYIPVFIANDFYKNRTQFRREHVVYSRFCSKYPKIEKYINTGRLIKIRDYLLVDMDFNPNITEHHEDVYVRYDTTMYKDATRTRWDPYKNEPIQQASGLCYVLRRIVNESEYRIVALLELLEEIDRAIIFYNFDYELEILLNLQLGDNVTIAQWNGHKHEPIPDTEKWIYLVQYSANEGWNCTTTDTIIFYSQNYSYKTMTQAAGRIRRLNTPYKDLYYYHFKSRSGIDLAISKALDNKKDFNERKWSKW